jgi:protein TonB
VRASAQAAVPWQRHPATIALVVLGLHVGALWALQSGLLRRAVETVVPAEILVELWSPPAPEVAPAPRPQAAPPAPRKAPAPAAAAPVPLAVAAPEPVSTPAVPQQAAPFATNNVATNQTNTRATDQNSAKNSAPPAATNAPAPAPRIELPSSDADYLNNPKPPYPALSKRLGEQGKVVVRTLIGTDGHAQEVQLQQSSGFERLDQAALNAARQWRYVPGKRDGVPQAMWFNVPFTFQLQ